jgi:Zn-dependent peptidase ImmA (M78 family)
MIFLNVPFLLDSAIVSKADAFLKDNNLDSIPIDIELVAETKYGIDIVPFSGLKREFGIDGLPSRDCKAVYVDKSVYEDVPNRLRFTVAHELGHIILHKQYIQQVGWASVEDWIKVYENIEPKDNSCMEYQAYVFAGLILVPQKFLKMLFVKRLPNINLLIKSAQQSGLARTDYIESAIFVMADLLSYQFAVSKEVITRRIKFDGLDKLIE